MLKKGDFFHFCFQNIIRNITLVEFEKKIFFHSLEVW